MRSPTSLICRPHRHLGAVALHNRVLRIYRFGLNRYAVTGRPTFQTITSHQRHERVCEVFFAKAWWGCCAAIPLGKGVLHDFPSTTYDRRHAGAESCPEHANLLSATGLSVRTPFRKVPGTAGPRAYPRLPGLPDQREETGARLCPHRGGGTAFPL